MFVTHPTALDAVRAVLGGARFRGRAMPVTKRRPALGVQGAARVRAAASHVGAVADAQSGARDMVVVW